MLSMALVVAPAPKHLLEISLGSSVEGPLRDPLLLKHLYRRHIQPYHPHVHSKQSPEAERKCYVHNECQERQRKPAGHRCVSWPVTRLVAEAAPMDACRRSNPQRLSKDAMYTPEASNVTADMHRKQSHEKDASRASEGPQKPAGVLTQDRVIPLIRNKRAQWAHPPTCSTAQARQCPGP
jgi:hypothetical protein